jgi:acetyl/propionyl-CoA carboxylase alpha subunit
LGALLHHPEYVDGSFDTKLIERDFSAYQKQVSATDVAEMAIAAFLHDWQSRKSTEPVSATLNGWRNIYYQSQHYILQWNGAEVKVEYRHKGDAHALMWWWVNIVLRWNSIVPMHME